MAIKSRPSDLALFGAPPAFRDKLHVGRPNVGSRERLMERIGEILDRRWLTNDGPCVRELERTLADFLGVEHCVATCNGTVALEIVIRALGLHGEVVVPSFTFVATAHALQWQGVTPVFCDVDERTHTLDPRQVERLITPRTTGIVGVHLWGRPCEIDALSEIAEHRGLRLLFDAAHAFACTHRGRMIGNFGDAEVFSLHATKFFNSSEGGVVATNDGALAERIRLMRNFGFAGFDNVVALGTNGKMSEMSAAVGLGSFESIDEFIGSNRRNYSRYRDELEGLAGVRLFAYDERELNNYQYVVVEVDEGAAGIDRDLLLDVLQAENVVARRYFYPGCHRMEPYRTLYPSAGGSLPVTERLAARVLVLPTGPDLRGEDVATICRVVRTAVSHAAEVSALAAAREGADAPGAVAIGEGVR